MTEKLKAKRAQKSQSQQEEDPGGSKSPAGVAV